MQLGLWFCPTGNKRTGCMEGGKHQGACGMKACKEREKRDGVEATADAWGV